MNPAGENTVQGRRLFINFIGRKEHQQGQKKRKIHVLKPLQL